MGRWGDGESVGSVGRWGDGEMGSGGSYSVFIAMRYTGFFAYCLLPLASCLLPLAYSLFPIPCSLLPTPYSLLPTPLGFNQPLKD
ncbi:hypothetical protein [Moorena sp. SIO4G3]|uniref:hypothetical protein n=1 Tax=Moorena sp. SIO4G3 TaxID=2607821 RepID=UPI00142AA5BB|nr:hypothetical protein [Moorena sp. SIO4G3]NEO80942.1 hypothetical protein [Moorena sp. SIO4G3]